MSIRTQLRSGLALLLLLIALVAALAWRHGNLLWEQTKLIHDHALRVQEAVATLKGNILEMRLEFRHLVILTDRERQLETLNRTEVLAKDIEHQFFVLRELYLGPRKHLDDAHKAFQNWRLARRSNVDLALSGRVEEAMSRVEDEGDIGTRRAAMIHAIKVIDEFARQDANKVFRGAGAQRVTLRNQLALLTLGALLLAVLTSYFIIARVRIPLRKLTDASDQFRQGNLKARCDYSSDNEFGALAASFNSLAEAIDEQIRSNERVAQVSKVMLRETDAGSFFRELLKLLAEQTQSQIAAVYLLSEDKTRYEHFYSIGIAAPGRASFSALNPEGEFGLALAKGELQHITAIPDDTRFTIQTTTGEFRPREILTLPLRSTTEVTAVLSLASVQGYSPASIALMRDILGTLTARAEGVLAYQEIQKMAKRLETQNEDLHSHRKELTLQAEELKQQNAELESQKRQLDEVNRLKSSFLSNMSHELRTPLNSVIALSGVLHRRLSTRITPEEHGYLGIIERNGKHLLSIINDILDLSRLHAGREEVRLEQLSISGVIEEVVAVLLPQAAERHVSLVNHCAPNLPPIISDSLKCRHILQNLVGNAVKFTERGSVDISASVSAECIEIIVRDTGIGIPPEHLAHIFDEFRQGDSSTSRKFGGTGLGLAIAKRYSSMLGGDITVQSMVGVGSTFTLRLPYTHLSESPTTVLKAPPRDDPATPEQADTAVPLGSGRKILIVEDNEPAVIQITDILQGQGYEVMTAHNGREALARVAKAAPDGMILDLMMPEVDGFDVLRAVRMQPHTVNMPVLVLTAKHLTREETDFLSANKVRLLIQKGDVSKQELLRAVGDMLGTRLHT